MRCAWQELLRIIPPRMRSSIDRLGKNDLQELRLRIGRKVMLCMQQGNRMLGEITTREDLDFCINTASNYSPWNASTLSKGFITAHGGHRIGICGECVVRNGVITGVRNADSICIRVARDFPGIAANINAEESVLILGSPGSGKTTLLRDLIRQLSLKSNRSIGVVDERGEIFCGRGLDAGEKTDVITGCDKMNGIMILLRTMGPEWIAVDEITDENDCEAMIQAGWCGVRLLATAHASSLSDLYHRPIYQKLRTSGLFSQFVVMHPDKSYHVERMKLCT